MSGMPQIIDGRFQVNGICSASGGMGAILHVTDLHDQSGARKVLKYCKDESPANLQRFKREVRLMNEFGNNPSVVKIHHSNLNYTPPYFVMDFYANGDLSTQNFEIQNNLDQQEHIFMAMLDSIESLHTNGIYHRDIKPQNFLIDDRKLVVSDLGLSTELDSDTRFTRSHEAWGTHAYLPPEFLNGGFKNADARGDIYMLGKSFYSLLTDQNPLILQLDNENIPRQLRPIIDRCCRPIKEQRYGSIAELRDSLRHAYDSINGRAMGTPSAIGILKSITTRFEARSDFVENEVQNLIDEMQGVSEDVAKQIALAIPPELFQYISDSLSSEYQRKFLKAYSVMVDSGDYAWGYAEKIAKYMSIFFYGSETTPFIKAEALKIAITGADLMNRFAAMDTCRAMIFSIREDELAGYVHDIIMDNKDTFIADTDSDACKSIAIRNALIKINPSTN